VTRLPIATLAGSLGSRMKITLSYWRVSACSPAQPSCDHRSEFQYPTRPVADPQAGGLRSLGGTLARSVQHQLRRAALDEHLFRGRSAVSGRRQAALWVLARSPAGLCADRHCPGGDTRGAAAALPPPERPSHQGSPVPIGAGVSLQSPPKSKLVTVDRERESWLRRFLRESGRAARQCLRDRDDTRSISASAGGVAALAQQSGLLPHDREDRPRLPPVALYHTFELGAPIRRHGSDHR
jgi:hypothetical protein